MKDISANITVAVMGCEVNGPGEAKDADLGIASGAGRALLFVKGEKRHTVPIENAAETLLAEARKLVGDG